jgi:WD40 repeat protein
MSRRFAVTLVLALPLTAAAVAQDAASQPPAQETAAAPVVDVKATRKLSSEVGALAVSPDGKWIAAGGHDGSVVLFATASGERRDAGKADKYIDALWFTADSQWVLAAPMDDDGKQILLAADVATGKVLRRIDVSAPEKAGVARTDLDEFNMAWPLPGGARVEVLRHKTIEVWDLASGERVEQKKNDDPWVQRKVRSPDGSLVALDGSGPIRIVEEATGAARFEVTPEEGGLKGNVLIGSHSTRPAGFATAAGVLLLRDSWDETKDPKTLTGDNVDKRTKEFRKLLGVSTRDGKQLWKRDLPEHVYEDDVVVGAEVAAVPADGKIDFVNCATGQVREKAPGTKKWSCAAVSPDGLTFWGGAEDGSVVFLRTFPAPKGK